MTGYPPSSPCMGLFKDGKLVFMLQRTDLQQMDEEQVSAALRQAFDEHCTRPGPLHRPEEVPADPALPGLRLADPARERAPIAAGGAECRFGRASSRR